MSYAAPPLKKRGEDVPVKTILATIGIVIATYLSWLLLQRLAHIFELIGIAIFFTLVLNPAVDFFERRLKIGRGLATIIVFTISLALFGALGYLFVQPLVDQTQALINRFPELVEDAQNGRGPIGQLVERYNLDNYVAENQQRLRDALSSSTGSIVAIFGAVASTIATLLTVLVLAFMMLLYGRNMVRLPLIFFSPDTQHRIEHVANDAAKAVTGYVLGNMAISVIAALVAFATMKLTGVPFAVVLAVWVAFADLIPLVGATLGAIPVVIVAMLHNPTVGAINLVVYVVYQQLENHLIQPGIMSRTVNLNPLVVLTSALIGVELAGLLGALLAIPVAGIIQVIGRDIFDHRHVRLKGEPTVGADEVPLSEIEEEPKDEK